jgi:hypothetical protein
VFYVQGSEVGARLREFVSSKGWTAELRAEDVKSAAAATAAVEDANEVEGRRADAQCKEAADAHYFCGAMIGAVRDYTPPTWYDWLGVSEYVSSWDGAHYPLAPSMPLIADTVLVAISENAASYADSHMHAHGDGGSRECDDGIEGPYFTTAEWNASISNSICDWDMNVTAVMPPAPSIDAIAIPDIYHSSQLDWDGRSAPFSGHLPIIGGPSVTADVDWLDLETGSSMIELF